jgi:hypothetical protein
MVSAVIKLFWNARTPEDQQRCIEIVEEATKMRRMYIAALSRHFGLVPKSN